MNSSKFKQSNLQQELDLLKRNNEWLDSELRIKSDEATKQRKDKTARVTELQRTNEELSNNFDSLKRTEVNLRKRIEELGEKSDNSLVKIQQMQEDASRKEEGYRAEVSNVRRLAELQGQSAATVKQRVTELDEELDKVKHDAADEVAQLQSDLEAERADKETALSKVELLETKVEELQSQSLTVRQTLSTPGTPHLNGTPEPGSPALSRSKGGTSFTQLYAQYNDMKFKLESEQNRNESLSHQMDDMIRQLEEKEPELVELRSEHDRLSAQVTELSSHLSNVASEKDAMRKEIRKLDGQLVSVKKQDEIHLQQQRDLAIQLRVLVAENRRHTDGIAMTSEEWEQVKEMANLHHTDGFNEGMTDTGRLITQQLVAFKDTFELQQKNEQLLTLVRQLGDKMEGEEAREKERQSERDQVELQKLRDRIERYKDQLKSLKAQSESYVRERDMFEGMLNNRRSSRRGGSLFPGESVNGAEAPQTPRSNQLSLDASPTTKQVDDYAKILKDMQNHFDSYRNEMSTDRRTLKDQVDKLAKEKGDLQSEINRANSQLQLAHDRYGMLQSSFNHARVENDELQKRNNSMAESAAKQDVRISQVAEDLVEANRVTESMRQESSNLKAEKELWKRVETRLNDDHRLLSEERDRLNRTIGDVQHLANERGFSEASQRRQLSEQVAELESQLRTAKKSLEDELDEKKKVSLTHEYESSQSRTRIDDLLKTLNNTKENLASATSARDELDKRVEDLKIELRNAQDRAEALQPRPTPRTTNNAQNDANAEAENQLNREQELGVQVADLTCELEIAKSQLTSAREQIEEYKNISQASEEQLEKVTESFDEYKDDTEKVAREKDDQIQDLERRVEEISNELSESNRQISDLQKSADDQNSRVDQQKAIFDEELQRVKDESERHQETGKYHQEDLKAQAEIAQQAQQSYENELVKHAEAAKSLQKVRNDYNALRLEVNSIKAEAEAARADLEQKKESWSSNKEQYESERESLNRRRTEVLEQNKILHEQLASITSQVSTLKEGRPTSAADGNASDEPQLKNLTEVISYLRREKDIVDVQLELSRQETDRSKAELGYTRLKLDEVQVKLDEERKSQSDKEGLGVSHNNLLEKINELNLFRESNMALRNDARQANEKLTKKTQQVEELTAKLEPLQTTINELENTKETLEGEMKLLQEDRDRWQQRTQNVLSKYNRVDPAEMDSLKEQLTSVQQKLEEANDEKQSLQGQLTDAQTQTQAEIEKVRNTMDEEFRTRRDAIKKQAVTKAQNDKATIDQLQKQVGDLNSQLAAAKSDLDEARKARDAAVPRSNSRRVQPSAPNGMVNREGDGESEEGEVGEDSGNATSKLDTPVRPQAQPEDMWRLHQQVSNLEAQVATLQSQIEGLNLELGEARQQTQFSKSEQPSVQHMEKLQQDLKNAQDEVEALTSRGQDVTQQAPQTSAGTLGTYDDSTKLINELRASISEKEAKISELDQNFETRVDSFRSQLNSKLQAGKARLKDEVKQEHDQEMAEIQSEHESEVQKLGKEHEEALANLRQELAEEIGRWKEATKCEGPAAAANARESVPAPAKEAPSQETLGQGTPTKRLLEGVDPATLEITEEEANDLCKKNTTVRAELLKNIRSRIDQQANRLNEEHSAAVEEKNKRLQELEELQTKAEKAKEHAVTMEGKKFAVKLNMAENRGKMAGARLQIFEKAASETPQKPVVEVWAVAKDFKPAPQGLAPQNTISVQMPSAQAATMSTSGQAPTPTTAKPSLPAPSSTSETKRPADEDEEPTLPKTKTPRLATETPAASQDAQQSNVEQPKIEPDPADNIEDIEGDAALAANAQQATDQSALTSQPTEPKQETRRQSQSGLLQQQPRSRRSSTSTSVSHNSQDYIHPYKRTNPLYQIPRGGQGSGIPRGSGAVRGVNQGGQAQEGGRSSSGQDQPQRKQLPDAPLGSGPAGGMSFRGAASGIPRGGGRGGNAGRGQGQGQGQGQGNGQGQGQGQGRGGGPGAQLNPGAGNFFPGGPQSGNKRAREDGQDGGNFGRGGKRARSGSYGGRF